MVLNFLMIGFSDGNGHPFSWSAILNGYNISQIEKCEFPAIVDYLSMRAWPDDCIQNALVKYIYCDDLNVATNISLFANIPEVLSSLDFDKNNIDAVIVARDDSENHFKYAHTFLKFGIPVLLDKPIAINEHDLDKLRPYIQNIFSHSSSIYSKMFHEFVSFVLRNTDNVASIFLEAPKSWERYGIHVVEPLVILLEALGCENVDSLKRVKLNGSSGFSCMLQNISISVLTTNEPTPNILFRVLLKNQECHQFCVSDVFLSFKSLLEDFIDFINGKETLYPVNDEYYTKVVRLLDVSRLE